MTAREGIERLLFAYCDGIDRGDLVATSELFGTDGLYGQVDGPAACGASQVLAAMQYSVHMYNGVPRTRHIVTNIVIDLNDDQITAQKVRPTSSRSWSGKLTQHLRWQRFCLAKSQNRLRSFGPFPEWIRMCRLKH